MLTKKKTLGMHEEKCTIINITEDGIPWFLGGNPIVVNQMLCAGPPVLIPDLLTHSNAIDLRNMKYMLLLSIHSMIHTLREFVSTFANSRAVEDTKARLMRSPS